MMYTDALLRLSSGCADDITREVLSYAPLPSNYVDPFAAQQTDAKIVMEMTGKAMSAWIEEARKANYFSRHFVQLSKMIMNGTVTMARGLVSLHNLGEDPAQAPMSIGDLIDLGSYHFRKSYLGVIQTVKSHPEISERLLMNQLGWANTLLRLFKTKDRLEKPVVSKPVPEAVETAARETLDVPAPEPLQTGTKEIKAFEEKAYGDISAIFEPGVYSAPRAYSALDGTPAPKPRKQIPAAGEEVKSAETEALPEIIAEEPVSDAVPDEEIPAGGPEKRPEAETESPETEKDEKREADPEKEDPADREKRPECEREIRKAGKPGAVPEKTSEGKNESGPVDAEGDIRRVGAAGKKSSGDTGPDPGVPPPEDPDVPAWVRIMDRVFQDDVPAGEERKVVFTFDEVRLLLAEPEFWACFPDMAGALQRSWQPGVRNRKLNQED